MGGKSNRRRGAGLVKDFDGKRAVDGVSLTVPEGSINGILGPNGAGKTTTIRMMLGIIDPSSGTPHAARPRPPARGRARRSAICPRSAGSTRRCRPPRRSPSWARCAACRSAKAGAARSSCSKTRGHGDWAKRPIRTLSKGMAQTVQLLGTIVHQPRLIVLDEPFSGLDAINQESSSS